MKIIRSAVFFGLSLLVARAQVVTSAPQNQAVAAGATATFSVTATGAGLSYQWQKNGVALAGATSATLAIANVQPDQAGIYTVVVTAGSSSTTASAVLGLTSSSKVIGAGSEIGANILHQNGNLYDQVLLTGTAATVTADAGQVTRISFVDASDDIVQVEFSGPGALTVVLSSPSGPAAAVNYNQPAVAYMKGHATIVIAGATEETNVSVFSVGSITAVNQSIFNAGVAYDGMADLASLAIISSNGKFGGIRTANTSYFASAGFTGIYAPGVQCTGPTYLGEISAFGSAQPVLLLASTTDARITGGDLLQSNGQSIAVSGVTQLNFVAGATSHGGAQTAQTNHGQLLAGGVNVTSQIAFSGPALVSLSATKADADESGNNSAEFTFTRTGPLVSPLTVNYGVSGSATNGIDYPALVGFITIPAFAASTKVAVAPLPDTNVESTETVTLTLAAGTGYALGNATAGTVSIVDGVNTLYVAILRPASTAGTSAASGLATIVLSGNNTIATVNVTFSNLSAGQVGAHLFLGNSTNAGDYVLNLPLGQVNGTQWNIQPTATYTSAQILDALRNGLIYVGLDSANYPGGELRGSFLTALGSQAFSAPAAAPAVSLTNLSATDAARLLTQGTFGPRQSEIDALTGGSVNAWIDAQIAAPMSSHRARAVAEAVYNPAATDTMGNPVPLPFHRQAAWFYNVLQGEDQLRQRVAFALSQILVVSDSTLAAPQYAEGIANFNDLLAGGAFGNFRTLLEQVTLNPIMGEYLSSLRNAKADPVAGTNPDENFAREVMQLFTIGLVKLQPDGTLWLDAQGLPIPTYDQTTITEMAKIFTGWAYYSTLANPNFRRGTADYIHSMMLYPTFHETATKVIVNNTVIPANLGGTEDLTRALDALFYHPNTGPFIARQLIQRLVTDNPSPAYVYRVAEVFANNGSAVRGDLGAVVRAILTDYEARSPVVTDDPGYGKLREPLLRLTAILRTFNYTSATGHYYGGLQTPETSLAQAALRAPSVFNFFEPGYVYPGSLAAAGLVAPEFQIANDTTAISTPNFLRSFVFATLSPAQANSAAIILTTEQGLATNVPALLDRLNLLMTSGQMSAATRTRITTAMNALTSNTTALERAQTAVLLVATSPEGSTQR
jgi:uncharacterized protein (DUF1800 family)